VSARAARGRVAPLLFLLLLGSWSLVYVWRTSFVVEGERVFTLWDDAMVSMQYAKNLARGEGLVWNAGGERVQGITNLGVTLAMAALHLLPIRLERLSLLVQLAGVATLLGLLLSVHRLAQEIFPEEDAVSLAAVALVAGYAPLAIWTLQGSDVGLVSLLLVCATTQVARAARTGVPPSLVPFALLALGILVRPDMTVAYVTLMTALPLLGRGARGAMLPAAVLLVAVWAALVGFSILYYGDPLPNTYYLKATGSPRALVWRHGLAQTLGLVGGGLLPILALALAGALVFLRRNRACWVCWMLVATHLAYNVETGGDWLAEYVSRFVVPAIPILLVLFAGAGARWIDFALARLWIRSPIAPRVALAALVLAAIPLASPGFVLAEWLFLSPYTMLRDFNYANYKTARYLREHTDPDTTVGVYWAGIPIYFSDRRGIDVLGKCDRHIAHLEVDRFEPAHSKVDWDYIVNEWRPDIILEGDRGLLAHEGFRTAYLRADAGWLIAFNLREESRDKVHDDRLMLSPYSPPPRTARSGS